MVERVDSDDNRDASMSGRRSEWRFHRYCRKCGTQIQAFKDHCWRCGTGHPS